MTDPELPTNEDIGFEKTDVDATALLKFGLGLVVATAVVVLLLWRLYFVFLAQEAARQPPPPIMKADRDLMKVPLPHLQDRPAPDLAAFRAREDDVLYKYGWVDKDAGVVRIPIEEAMRIVAERGLPATASATPVSANPIPSGEKQ